MEIVNKLGAYKIGENDLSGEMFDKRHAEFRRLVFINILKSKRDKFISKFRFEGDPNFTIQRQKILLREVFMHGYAGILNYEKAIKNALDPEVAKMVKEFDLKLQSIPLAVAPSHFDTDNLILKGTGVTTPRHNVGSKSYKVTNQDTAFMKFDEDGYTGLFKWLPYIYLQATGMTVLKKRTATMDKKLVSNNVNNSYENVDFDDIYNVAQTFLNLSPSQEGLLSSPKSNDINVAKMLQDKIAKLDFTAQETVSELLDFIDANRNSWDHMFGERTNTNKKSERNISNEFDADEVHFALMELDLKEQAQEFANQYEKIFGVKLTVVSTIDKTIEKLQEQQRAMSGGGADREKGKENDK